jgi:hypothetical protein
MMNDDLSLYPVYMFYGGRLQTADWIKNTQNYDHYNWQIHHFIRQSVRKNSPDFYKRVEYLQKLILVPKQMNYDLETMGEKRFKEVWGVNKDDFVFSRKKWREGYYDADG